MKTLIRNIGILVSGDFTPRQRTVDFIDCAMNGGVTAAISAGAGH